MKQDFTYLFEIIWNKFIPNKGERKSLPALASYFGHEHKGKVTAWSKGQWPNAYDCWLIHKKMGLNLEWLLTGEEVRDDSLSRANEQSNAPSAPQLTQPTDLSALEREIAVLRELVASKDEIIALQKKMLCQLPAWEVHGEVNENFTGSHQLLVRTAPGTPSVAPLQPAKND